MKTLTGVAAVLLATLPMLALAGPEDTYPDKAVRIVVPFAAGGSTDVVARILAEKLQAQFKQPFVVDNRAGASGNIGAELVAKSPADGYTLLMGATGILSINDHLYGKLNYNAQKDFAPVAYATENANILVVSPTLPVKDVPSLVSLAKTQPGTLSFASSGPGSSTHLSGELFKSMAGVNLLHVPYKGSSAALTDLLGGNVSMLFDNAPSSIGFVQQGKLRALAVTSRKRIPGLPNVPTLDEAGIKGYESLSWSGVVAPAATPRPIVMKLNRAIDQILKSDDVRAKLVQLGVEPVGGTPEDFAKLIQTEHDKWGTVIKTADIKLN
ncbi:Bug family tripartite tricarboxylate transporter substrate binding protein [Cupriavidus plantarum]|uniref:Tripartite-type tricarboxylate transporter receptor subunit TctC n=1 Tax=Cupriavidus plantarum TaxID=942865 RepID=A0A316EQP2_9BURK|nr:tripartite tricarboxylate transporter substrate binding protein [Cupriavidus plantarum]PWK34160.1 tripartite-type tricarboxylate transporter receptor subunit TctC [Cupriavidus plantarum]REE89295.1 tripartite-type tricarboxylate transporter receptor subunit TctC [Cupriavidus plantarum]RLK31685.1 tripartite-type tricarboxylate transporter receptor subunit TctC [Cupriavidus plantarum]